MENCQCEWCMWSRKYGANANVTATRDELLAELRLVADCLLNAEFECDLEKDNSKRQSARIAELEAALGRIISADKAWRASEPGSPEGEALYLQFFTEVKKAERVLR